MNSGEGGLLISDDAEAMARAIMLSGSYMLFDRHRAAPPPETFARIKYETPNVSGRMDNLRAAILRPQLADLDRQCARWNALYAAMDDGLADTPGLTRIDRPHAEQFVASSYQFLLLDWSGPAIEEVLARCARRGVELKWFGADEPHGFTSRYDSWRYAPSDPMPASDRVLRGIVDMRLPLTFSTDDCAQIARIIRAEVGAVWQAGVAAQ
jgi:dTDP-4-amino-4,6-dideoxygalactose transaminase